MTKTPANTPSAIPALTATSDPPLEDEDEDEDVDVDEADDSDAAVAAVVVELAKVEEADVLEVDGVEVAATKPPLISVAVNAVASIAVGKSEDDDKVESVWPSMPLLIPFALSNPASDDVVFVSLVLPVEVEEGESVVKSPPVHPDDVIVVYMVTTLFSLTAGATISAASRCSAWKWPRL